MPIAAEVELEERPVRPVRVLGEDLVLYRHGGGYGLVGRWCPHRQFDLSFATVETSGIRCSFHGWLFDGEGRCLEQPLEQAVHPESTFKDVCARADPVQAKAGLLWAFSAPSPRRCSRTGRATTARATPS
jgi:5,5'-dehydrodivanillate O-demethylase